MGITKKFSELAPVALLVDAELSIRSKFLYNPKTAESASTADLFQNILERAAQPESNIEPTWLGTIFNYQTTAHSGIFYELETRPENKGRTHEYLLSHTVTGPLILLVAFPEYQHMEVMYYHPKNDDVYKKEHELHWIATKAHVLGCKLVGVGQVKRTMRTTLLESVLHGYGIEMK
jgi:hypothetical protein